MKSCLTWMTIIALLMQTGFALAQSPTPERADTRLYLGDGTLVEGQMVEKGKDLIIMRVKDKIFTFERTEVDKIVTLESLGGGAKTVSVTEFPYISFMGGGVAFGLLSWLQFDRASDNEAEADLNREHNQPSRAKKLDDKASRARLYGWSTAVLAAGSVVLSLMPHKTTRRVFPELSNNSNGVSMLNLAYQF
ncbi:MAG: hypothetical protein ACI906_005138 [Candidatus Latescibacterota bacterium]|jgi:hypothetical protein